jgi:flagellar hook-associated protein 3 FlgL
MDRISSLTLHNLTAGSALDVQTKLAQAQIQESSGLVAQDFGTLGGSSTAEMLNLETNISQAQTFASDAQTVGSRTQGMYNALGSMASIVNQLQTQISRYMSAPDTTGLLSGVQNIQQQLLSQVNAQIGGRYLFAGSNINTPPASLTNYPTLQSTPPYYDPTQPDTSYYTGDNSILSVRVSLQQTLSYGVTANNPAFEEAMRSVEAVVQAASTSTIAGPTVTGTTNYASATTALGLSGSFAVNGTHVTITPTMTLSDIAAAIPGASVSGGGPYQLTIGGGPLTLTGVTGSALSSLGIATTPISQAQLTSALQQALDVSNQAVRDLSNLQASVADVSKQLSDAQQQQTTYVTFLQNSLSNVKDADAAQTASLVSQYQTQLQASYMAVVSVTKMSLAQYL